MPPLNGLFGGLDFSLFRASRVMLFGHWLWIKFFCSTGLYQKCGIENSEHHGISPKSKLALIMVRCTEISLQFVKTF